MMDAIFGIAAIGVTAWLWHKIGYSKGVEDQQNRTKRRVLRRVERAMKADRLLIEMDEVPYRYYTVSKPDFLQDTGYATDEPIFPN